MSYGDSKAVFRRRCEEIGLTAEVVELIVNHGLDTMAKSAFSCNFSPGSSDESPLIQLAKEIFRRAPSTVEMSCVRRLFSESSANIAADIKNSVEATDDMPTRKLAPLRGQSDCVFNKDSLQESTSLDLTNQETHWWTDALQFVMQTESNTVLGTFAQVVNMKYCMDQSVTRL